MSLQTEKFIRKVRPVEAVKVTEDNLSQVAGWCRGLVVPVNGLGQNNSEPYVHVHVQNPRKDSDSQAFVGMWVIKEDYNRFRVVTNKQFRNSYEPIEKPKKAIPSPAAMPKKAPAPKPETTQVVPTPTQVGAVAVDPSDPNYESKGPKPIESTTSDNPSETDNTKKENHQMDQDNTPVEATEPAEAIEPPLSETKTEDENPSDTSEVMHGDALAGDDNAMNGEESIGEITEQPRNIEQSETDDDGTVQLGAPLSDSASVEHEDLSQQTPGEDDIEAAEDDVEESAPKLCGKCGSEVVADTCSNDIEHDVDFTPTN